MRVPYRYCISVLFSKVFLQWVQQKYCSCFKIILPRQEQKPFSIILPGQQHDVVLKPFVIELPQTVFELFNHYNIKNLKFDVILPEDNFAFADIFLNVQGKCFSNKSHTRIFYLFILQLITNHQAILFQQLSYSSVYSTNVQIVLPLGHSSLQFTLHSCSDIL